MSFEKNTSQDTKRPALKINHKIMIGLGLFWIAFTFFIQSIFLPQLASGQLEQVKNLGFHNSFTITELAKMRLQERNQKDLNKSLQTMQTEILRSSPSLIEVSVILSHDGSFYASSNTALQGKKAHPSLLSSLHAVIGKPTEVHLIEYQVGRNQIQSFQFLKNIYMEINGQPTKVGITQILIGYEHVLSSTTKTLWLTSLLILGLVLLILGFFSYQLEALLHPILTTLSSFSQRKYENHTSPGFEEQQKAIHKGFRKLARQLKQDFDEQQKLHAQLLEFSPAAPSESLNEVTWKKAELTCLCATVPKLQEKISSLASDQLMEYLKLFLEDFHQITNANGGQIVKVLGNKVYVLFEGINSINNALRCAIQSNKQWKAQNHERKIMGETPYVYGIGIHSSIGIAGRLSQLTGNYTVIGETITQAAYLCDATHNGDILITASLLGKANNTYKHEPAIDLKVNDLSDQEEIIRVTDSVSLGEDSNLLKKQAHTQTQQAPGSVESNLVDMLEETLDLAPLDLNIPKDQQTSNLLDITDQAKSMLDFEAKPIEDTPPKKKEP